MSKTKAEPVDHITGAVVHIDRRIAMIQKQLEPFEALIEERNRLQAARRALLSERSPTSGGGRGLTQEEVVNKMRELEETTVHALAKALGTNEAAVRGHLNRGRGERFNVSVNGGGQKVWSLRDPETEDQEDDDE